MGLTFMTLWKIYYWKKSRLVSSQNVQRDETFQKIILRKLSVMVVFLKNEVKGQNYTFFKGSIFPVSVAPLFIGLSHIVGRRMIWNVQKYSYQWYAVQKKFEFGSKLGQIRPRLTNSCPLSQSVLLVIWPIDHTSCDISF